MLKKVLFLLVVMIGILFIAGYAYITTAPDLPENADDIYQQVISTELPEFYHGEAAYAQNGDVKLWYELNKPEGDAKGTVILIMGYGSTSINWPEYFFMPMVEAGYQVIRFDHRDIGLSTWLKDWDESDPYTLEDIGDDVIAILDDAAVDKAHILGMSMGGMVAQSVAINHPDRTLSLTSQSSTAYFGDESLAGIWPETMKDITRYTAKFMLADDDLESAIKYSLTVSNLFKGNYKKNNLLSGQLSRYEYEKRNGSNPEAAKHHEAAINASGSRYDALQKLTIPTLVIHGKADPLVNFEHGVKTAELIPNAKRLWVEDLGHDMPLSFTPKILGELIPFFDQHNGDDIVEHDLSGVATKKVMSQD